MPLMPEDIETRTVLNPRTGTKICILIGLAFIVAAVYFYFVPVTDVRTTSGSIFGCGTAAHPADNTFAKGICWRITDVEKYRAIACMVIGVLTIVLGSVMFGVDRRTETRRTRRHLDDYEDRAAGEDPDWDRQTDGRRRNEYDGDRMDDTGHRAERGRDGREDRHSDDWDRDDADNRPVRPRRRRDWDSDQSDRRS